MCNGKYWEEKIMKINDWLYCFLIIMNSTLYICDKLTFEKSVVSLLTIIGIQNFVNSIRYWRKRNE